MNKDEKIEKPVVYSAMEVAKICGVVNQTAINWIRNEYLKAFKTPGGQYRVYPEDLIDFMRRNKMHVPVSVMDAVKPKAHLPEKSVLVVDDDKTWNDVMCSYLRSKDKDLTLYQAFDGFDAGSKMASLKPKIVVLDLDLPGIDGVKICRNINQSDSFGKPAVIVVTALDDEETEKDCLDLGVVRYFRKPLNLPMLSETLEDLFVSLRSDKIED